MKKESSFKFCIEVSQDGEILKIENYPGDGLNLATDVFIPFFRYVKEHRPELLVSILSSQSYVDQENMYD